MRKIFIVFLLIGLYSIGFAVPYSGDSLGDHRAKRDLNMDSHDINNTHSMILQEYIQSEFLDVIGSSSSIVGIRFNSEGHCIEFSNLILGAKTTNYYLYFNASNFWRSDNTFRTTNISVISLLSVDSITGHATRNIDIIPADDYEIGLAIDADSDLLVGTGVHESTWGITSLTFSTSTTLIQAVEANVKVKYTHASSQPIACLLYSHGGSTVTEINAGNTYELLCGTWAVQGVTAWFNAVTDANGNNNRLTYVGINIHKFKITLNGCLKQIDAGATTAIVKLYINDADASADLRSSVSINNQNDDASVSLAYIVLLEANDVLEWWITTDDGDEIAGDWLQWNVFAVN